MKMKIARGLSLLMLAAAITLSPGPAAAAATAQKAAHATGRVKATVADAANDPLSTPLAAGEFGTVRVYHPSGPVQQVVLFVSGDGGWNLGVVDMALKLREQGALVAGIDIRTLFKNLNAAANACSYPAAMFDRLSRLLQQNEGVRDYHVPLLMGYSSGATLVYALLNEAPKGTFAGGLSLGFCPDLDLAKPLCKGEQLAASPRKKGVGFDLQPVTAISGPWIVFQGDQDEVCAAPATQDFVAGIDGTQLVMLPKVGHGYSVQKNWMPQFLDAYATLGQSSASVPSAATGDVDGLPLLEVPGASGPGDSFVLLITGDGGYAGLDQKLAGAFSEHDRPVVVLNSLKYFWTARTPQGVADDVDRIIRHYQAAWRRPKVVLVGYSQGADVLPFVLNRLPAQTVRQIAAAAAIGISGSAVFEFHITNWVSTPGGTPTLPELRKMTGLALTCVYGAEETDSACPQLRSDRVRAIKLPGGHRFAGDFAAVARAVLSGIE